MTVEEIMQIDVATCRSSDDIATASRTMIDRRCGFLPVIDGQGVVAGVVTDRDLNNAANAEHERSTERIAVAHAVSHPVINCFPDENLKVVLATMAKHHVRRLVVADKNGHLRGVLSVDDVICVPRHHGTPTAEEIVDALKGISAPRMVEA